MSSVNSFTSPAEEMSTDNFQWTQDISYHFDKVLSLMTGKQRDLTKEADELQTHKRELDSDYKKKISALEQEKEMMAHMHQVQTEKVKLDVGGTLYATSKSTLSKDPDSMLAVMFCGRHALHPAEDGSYFIDRDGASFRYVLNYMRGSIRDTSDLPSDHELLKDLRREADFYQLPGFVLLLDRVLSPVPDNTTDFSQQYIDTLLSSALVMEAQGVPRPGAADQAQSHGAFQHPLDQRLPVHRESPSTDQPPETFGSRQKVTRCALDFSGKQLKGLSFAHTSFLHSVSFANACLADASFYGCEFSSLAYVDFEASDLTGCDFRQCKGKEPPHRSSLFSDYNRRSGLVSGSSSNVLLSLLQDGKVNFRNSNWMQALFDQTVWNCLQLSCPAFKVLPTTPAQGGDM